jgi:N-dimethylarginine dimethylaminohydrolase
MELKLNVKNETGALRSVIVGIAHDRGEQVHENNPKISEHKAKGTLPSVGMLINQVNGLVHALKENGVEVYRPANLPAQDQIFARDISFVIDDVMVKSSMRKKNRSVELEGIQYIFDRVNQEKLVEPPETAHIEGGDVLVNGDFIYVGIGERTNFSGYEFLEEKFPNKTVIPFLLNVSDDPYENILHLDCAFQPVGDKYAILYEKGFKKRPDAIYDIYGEKNLIHVNQNEMYEMNPNIFSLAPDKLISDIRFVRLNNILRKKGIEVIEIPYGEVSKFGGLFRCSTCPLERE